MGGGDDTPMRYVFDNRVETCRPRSACLTAHVATGHAWRPTFGVWLKGSGWMFLEWSQVTKSGEGKAALRLVRHDYLMELW